jgi:hypothetical protein
MFYFCIIHHHALLGNAFVSDNVAGQSDLNGVAMAMHVSALAIMGGYSVAGVEFQPACD